MMVEMTSKRQPFSKVATSDDDEEDGIQQQATPNAQLPESSPKTRWAMYIVCVAFLMMLTSMATMRVTAIENKNADGFGARSTRRWVPTLLTDISPDPDYSGPLVPRGRITVRFEDDESEMLIRYELEGLEPNCQACGIHIHEGNSCRDPKGHYFNSSVYDTDPWTGASYTSNAKGIASNAIVMPTVHRGEGSNEATTGHVMVIHGQDGTRIGCGILKRIFNINVMEAEMGLYPGYTGTTTTLISPKGTVRVMSFEDDVLRIRGTLDGLEPNCQQCGMHIHVGLTCGDGGQETAAEATTKIGDHWFNSEMMLAENDPWKAQKATYTSDERGHTEFAFYVFDGYDYENNVDHALVLHGQDGTRIGCGILKPAEIYTPKTKSPK